MKSLEQIIRDNMSWAEREEFDAIALQRRMITQNYIEKCNELDEKRRAIIDKHKKMLDMA